MSDTITFFRQMRRDGGIRTGIEIGGDSVFDRFEDGQGESDPALNWYVDVRCKGSKLPRRPEAAKQWLVDHEAAISRLLNRMADEVPAGLDPSDWPLTRETKVDRGRVTVTLACSAVRRLDALHIAEVLRNIAATWISTLDGLESQHFTAHGTELGKLDELESEIA